VVAAAPVVDDAAVVVLVEPEAVPFKQLVFPKLNENTKSIIIIKSPHTARLDRERSRLCRRPSAIMESDIETSAL
jgi:hypothetical protein